MRTPLPGQRNRCRWYSGFAALRHAPCVLRQPATCDIQSIVPSSVRDTRRHTATCEHRQARRSVGVKGQCQVSRTRVGQRREAPFGQCQAHSPFPSQVVRIREVLPITMHFPLGLGTTSCTTVSSQASQCLSSLSNGPIHSPVLQSCLLTCTLSCLPTYIQVYTLNTNNVAYLDFIKLTRTHSSIHPRNHIPICTLLTHVSPPAAPSRPLPPSAPPYYLR